MMPDHDDSRKTTLTPDDKLRLRAATIRAKRRLGLIPPRSILTALVSAMPQIGGAE